MNNEEFEALILVELVFIAITFQVYFDDIKAFVFKTRKTFILEKIREGIVPIVLSQVFLLFLFKLMLVWDAESRNALQERENALKDKSQLVVTKGIITAAAWSRGRVYYYEYSVKGERFSVMDFRGEEDRVSCKPGDSCYLFYHPENPAYSRLLKNRELDTFVLKKHKQPLLQGPLLRYYNSLPKD